MISLHDPDGGRKYLTGKEQKRFLAVADADFLGSVSERRQ